MQVGLGERTAHYPKRCCWGASSSVSRLRAFVTRPAILFADEPTGSLDAATGHAVIDLMFELNRTHGATLVLVTHDVELARALCDDRDDRRRPHRRAARGAARHL